MTGARHSAALGLSVLVPVYNELSTLGEMLDRVMAADTLGLTREVILVDDGSTDGSRELAQEMAAERAGIRLLAHPKNRGKGAALRTGFAEARGELVLIQDADLEYDPADYPTLLRPFQHGADVVYGSRFHPQGSAAGIRPWQRGGNWALTRLCNLLTGLRLSDMETGFKVIRRHILWSLTLREESFGIEPELTVKLAALRPRPTLVEVPIHYTSRDWRAGKKLTPRDGLRALYCLARYRLIA